MKKIILTAIAVCTFGFVNAQKAHFGLKGGLNIANQSYSGEDAPSPSSIIGFQVGGFVDIKITDKFSFQPELLYSTQGSKFDLLLDLNGMEYKTENTFKIAYVNIPLMFKFYATNKFILEAGPQIGFLTSSKIKVNVERQSVTQDLDNVFKSVDFGLNFGAGYDFTKNVSGGIRYNVGLSNVADAAEGSNDKIKNGVFSILMSYKL